MSIKKIKWDEGRVIDTFNLKRLRTENMPLLTDWISAVEDLSDIDTNYLEKKRRIAEFEIDAWNEEELKMRYLSFIVDFADYQDQLFNKQRTKL